MIINFLGFKYLLQSIINKGITIKNLIFRKNFFHGWISNLIKEKIKIN